jgi:hypothetical protein
LYVSKTFITEPKHRVSLLMIVVFYIITNDILLVVLWILLCSRLRFIVSSFMFLGKYRSNDIK